MRLIPSGGHPHASQGEPRVLSFPGVKLNAVKGQLYLFPCLFMPLAFLIVFI